MSKVLYLKWRPGNWEEVIGQGHVITTLKNAVHQDRVSHAQIFSGPRGTGKTSTARVLAKAVNCLAEDLSARPCCECAHCQSVTRGDFLDLIEIDAASNTSVDDVRELRDKINFSPNLGRYKVYVIDEVHMLSTSAFNALLKTLEEPPDHAIFILATTEIHKIPVTVISRCQRHDFRRIPVSDIVAQLKVMAAAENINVSEEVLGLIARQATGSLRDAISILDQLSSAEGEITPQLAHQVLGTSPDEAVLNFIDAMLAGDPGGGLDTLHHSAQRGNDPGQFSRQVVGYLRNVLLAQMDNAEAIDVPENLLQVIRDHADRINLKQLLEMIRIFNRAVVDRGTSWQPTLPLEMAFLEGLDLLNQTVMENSPKVQRRSAEPKSRETQPDRSQTELKSEETAVEQIDSGAEGKPGPERITVLQRWNVILDQVREINPATQGILNSCKPLGIKDNQLVLSFRSDAIKEKMESNDHIKICQDVTEKVIGVRLPILCVVGGKDQSGLPDGVDPNGLVAAVVRDLGGTLVSDGGDQE
jgi:DNA polymerase-3 subunit gamma/tau